MANDKKTKRQLLLYEICFSAQEVEVTNLMQRLHIGEKPILRDMHNLTDAGFVRFGYSRKDKSYKMQIVLSY